MESPLSANAARSGLNFGHAHAHAVLQHLLRAAREHLDLDVAFISEFRDGRRIFRYVDGGFDVDVVRPGDSDPIEGTYCLQVAVGRLPRFLADPREHPVSAALPVTDALPVGTHLSVPIRFSDGRTYGTFCCFALDVRRHVHPESIRSLQMLAELAAAYLEDLEAAGAERRQRRELIQAVLDDPHGMMMAFQPLRDLGTMEIVAFEALARFPNRHRGPEWFFNEAANVGLGTELELRAAELALQALNDLPGPIRLNINVSAVTLCSRQFFHAVRFVPRDRLVVEVTEHAAIEDYTELKAASARLKALGLRLAIDDVGMGFAGLERILESSPDELKLDAVVVRDVDSDTVKQALVEAFCSFGARAGFNVVAEGIETEDELRTLRTLGAKIGQGYHLGRPDRLPSHPLKVGEAHPAH